MIIRVARKNELEDVMSFYDEMCKVLDTANFLPEGNKGGFPSKELVQESIKNEELYIGVEDSYIIAGYIINNQTDPVYDSVEWQIEAKKENVSIIHALRVLPAYGGRGYSKKLVEHAINIAKERNQTAIRLDCIEGNDVPQKMYQSFGFKYIDTVKINYDDIGKDMEFLVFELVL